MIKLKETNNRRSIEFDLPDVHILIFGGETTQNLFTNIHDSGAFTLTRYNEKG